MTAGASRALGTTIRRRAADVACVIFALFALATAVFWARSYAYHDSIGYRDRERWSSVHPASGGIRSRAGALMIGYVSERAEPEAARVPVDRQLNRSGFGYGCQPVGLNMKEMASWRTSRFFGLFDFHLDFRTDTRISIGGRPGTGSTTPLTITSTVRYVTIPHWSLIAVLSMWPTLRFTCGLRRRRIRAGHCPHCNYDLRAHTRPDARCPECGAAVPPPPAAASPV
jgi:hypothetical protein